MIDRIVDAASITHSTVSNNNSPYVILIDEESSIEDDAEVDNEPNERGDVEPTDAKSSANHQNPNDSFILNRSQSLFKHSISHTVAYSLSLSLMLILFQHL
jgi:hypothetical protein